MSVIGKSGRLSVDEWFALASRNWSDAELHKAIVQILRAADSMLLVSAATLQSFQLQPGDFGVLTTLRVGGPPYELTPTAIYRAEVLSSGGLTKILYRLEKSGLISRRENSADKRSRLVRLTRKGKATIEQATAANVRIQGRYFAGLSATEQEKLTELLGKLLKPIESVSSEFWPRSAAQENEPNNTRRPRAGIKRKNARKAIKADPLATSG